MLQTVSRLGTLRFRLLAETALRLAPLLVSAAVPGALTSSPAQANPKGGQVVAGSATIASPSATQLQVTQTTNRAAIDWQSFDIAPGERTSFVQPSAAAWALNRVKAADPSVIAGRLTSNGSLVLINPNGILFSKGSQVDVHSLIATPSDISNANFMAGRMKFDKPPGNPAATVVNQGTITVAQHGLAALVAPGVANAGLIQAKLGKVVLAGAETFAVDFYGDGLISFDVGSQVKTVPIGPDGKPMTSLVSNTGRINAPGGTVLLTADAVAGILENVVDMPGTIMARSVGQTPGAVTIDAGPTGAANLSGKINVSGLKPGQVGGSATVTGGSVKLASTARLAARGNTGGGTVRIGGGPHGQDPSVRNAQTTTVPAGAIIDASATANGNGGQVTIWSDGTTGFNGSISARGGSQGGNGGFIETSGRGQLVVGPSASATASAPKGTAGQWLLDPDSDVTITSSGATCGGPVCSPVTDNSTISASTINTALNGGTSVVVTTSNPNGTQTGNILVGATPGGNDGQISLTNPNAVSLTLDAGAGGGTGGIFVNSPIMDNTGTLILINNNPVIGNRHLSLTFNAAGSITFNNNLEISKLTATAGTNTGTGGISINSSIVADPNANGNFNVQLASPGSITETSLGTISVGQLRAVTYSDPGSDIKLDNNGNHVLSVTLNSLNSTQSSLGSGNITFINDRQLILDSFGGLEVGVSTKGNVTLGNFILNPSQTTGGVFQSSSPGAVTNPITANDLVVDTTRNANSPSILPDIIRLDNLTNTVTGNVTLRTFNGDIKFYNSTGFTIAGVTTPGTVNIPPGTVTLQAGGPLFQTGAIVAQNLIARTQLDRGAGITLTNAGNAVPGNVTLSALNTAGTAPAAGAISFLDSTGFTVAAQPANGVGGQEIGVDTTGTVSLTSSGSLTVGGMVAGGAVNGSQLSLTAGNAVNVNGSVDAVGQAVIFVNAGAGGISINGPIASAQNASVYGIDLVSQGPITETGAGSITVPALRALTESNVPAPISLTNPANSVPVNVTLTALNAAGNAFGSGDIGFTNSTGVAVVAVNGGGQGGLELGANTTGNISLSARGSIMIDNPVNGSIVTLSSTGPISEQLLGTITATNLVVRTQNDLGAAITLQNAGNTVPRNVTLSALNAAGTAPAAGAISFVDSTGFTVAGIGGQEIGVNTTSRVSLIADGPLLETGVISAAALTGSSVGGATLTNANQLSDLGPFTNIGGGNFALTNAAPLTVNGTVTTGSGGITLNTGASQLTVSSPLLSTGTISLTADAMSLGAQIGGSGAATGQATQVNLAPFTAGQAVSLGAGAAIGLALTDTELNEIRSTDVAIGSAAAGPLTFNGAFNASAAFGTDTAANGFSLITGSTANVSSSPFTLQGGFAINAGTTITLNSSITTPGAQSYTDTVLDLNGATYKTTNGAFTETGATVLTSAVTVDTSAGNQNIVFQTPGTIDGGFGLTLKSGSGAVTIGGAVGGTTPLASLTANGGTITLDGNVTTAGAQSYTDTALDLNGASYKTTSGAFTETGATVLTSAVTVDTSAGNQNIVFQTPGTIDGGFGLTLKSGSGAVTIGGAVGGTTPLASLTASGGTITLDGNVTTAGTQSYTDTVLDLNSATYKTTNGAFTETGATVLTSAVTVDTSAGNQNIVFQTPGTIDGGFGLTLKSGSGAVTIGGAVGGTTPLASLTASGGTITLDGNVTTAGAQSYTDTVLDLNGATYKTTNGAFTETGATMLTSAVTVDTSAGNQNIVFQTPGPIDGGFGLTLKSGSGAVTIGGAVGGTTPLASLTASGGTITLDGNVTTAGAQSYTDTVLDLNGASYKTTNGAFTGTGATMLTSAVTVDTSAGNQNIVFQTPGTIDGGFGLTLKSGSGAVTIGGAVGGTTPLASLTASGGTIALGGNVTTTGLQTLTQTGAGATLTLAQDLITPQTVTVTSAGKIDQTSGVIHAGTLTGISAGTASLAQPGNMVTNLGAFSTGNGDFTLTDGQALNLTGLLNAGIGLVTLQTGGALQQTGAITAQNLVVRTQLDAGAAITLTNSGNAVPGNVTLSALNSSGTGPAPGAIDFVDSSGFTVAAQPANGLNRQEIGVNTTANVDLEAGGDFLMTNGGASTLAVSGSISSGGGAIALGAGTGGILISGSIASSPSSLFLGLISTGAISESATGSISAPNVLALTENDAGAPIMLTGAGNRVDAVSLSALNAPGNPAGPAPAPGNISFVDSKDFQIFGSSNTASGAFSSLARQIFGINTSGDALLTSAGTIAEQPGSMIKAARLVADAGGAVNLDTVANAVGVLSGNARTGSFRFLNADPLTIGTVGPQSGVIAGQDLIIQTDSTAQGTGGAGALNITANMSAGGNLLVTSHGSLTVNGNVDLAAGKNIVLDSNGPFTQSGVLTVSADPPALVVDTTDTAGTGAQALLTTLLSSPSNGGADTITTPNVVNALPPATLGPPSNPISFADLQAGGSIVVLIGNSGAISGTINVGQLGISGNGASAQLFGSIGGNSTSSAAQLAVLAGGITGQYLFNACPIGGAGCTPFSTIAVLTNNLDILTGRAEVIESIIAATAQQSQTEVDILLSRPREFDRFTGRPQDEDIDASIINIFDEERLCEELRLKSPEAAREVCR